MSSSPSSDSSPIRLHWLTGTFPAQNVPSLCGVLERYFGEPDALSRGVYKYGEGVGFGEAMPRVVVCFSRYEEDGYDHHAGDWSRPDAMLEIPGAYLDSLPGELLVELLGNLHAVEFRASRFDAAFDDYAWVKSPQEIAAEYARPRNFAPCFDWFPYEDPQTGGYTVQFGKKGKQGSGTQVVIYDKNKQSAGEVNAVRYEVRFFKERAAAAFGKLVGAENPFDGGGAVECHGMAQTLGSFVGGAIDFFDVDAKGRRQRAKWWAAILGRLRRV